MAVPATSWDETSPADTDLVSSGDDAIRTLKTSIREVFDIDHKFESSGQDTDWGYHKKLTLIEQASDPTAVADNIILYAKEVGSKCELHCIDEDSNVIQLTDSGEFVGGMDDEVRMWYGTLATIPNGWALCDGSGGTPNMIAHFIRGINTAVTEPGTNTGGADSITLTSSHLPAHTHSISAGGSHTHKANKYVAGSGSRYPVMNGAALASSFESTYSQSDGTHSHTVSTEGSDAVIDNRPVYYELAFIVKT